MSRSKKRRAEGRDSGPRRRSECRYKGCGKPTLEKGNGSRHQFCGWTHRDFVMAHLADTIGHGETHENEDAFAQDRCKLPGCGISRKGDSEFKGHKMDFCGKAHALKYIEDCTRLWMAKGRLCQFHPCSHHVWVDETSDRCEKFCSFGHAKLGAAERGVSTETSPVKSTGDDGDSSRGLSLVSNEASLKLQVIDSRLGYDDSLDFVSCLEAAFLCHPWKPLNIDPSGKLVGGKLVVGINPINFHPFELVEDFSTRLFLWYIDDASQPIQRSTKDGYHWKQTSKSHRFKCGRLLVKYFGYESKQGNNDYSQKRWKMHQIWPSADFVKEITRRRLEVGLEVPKGYPVIYKIFQDSNAERAWHPVRDQVDDVLGDEAPRTVVLQEAESGTTSGGLKDSPPSSIVTYISESATDEVDVHQSFGEINPEDNTVVDISDVSSYYEWLDSTFTYISESATDKVDFLQSFGEIYPEDNTVVDISDVSSYYESLESLLLMDNDKDDIYFPDDTDVYDALAHVIERFQSVL